MNSVDFAYLCATIAAFFFGAWITRREMRRRGDDLDAANEDLRERLAIVTGQLADERQRHALRINRAHEGACKAAKTRKAMRIKLPEVVS